MVSKNNLTKGSRSKKFNVVVIGLGRMGKNHLRLLSQDSRFNVIGLVDPRVEQRTSVENHLNYPAYGSINQIKKLDFDCAVVASSSSTHYKVASYLVSLGKPFLVEKPFCHNSASARLLASSIYNKKIKVAVGHIERFNPAVRKLSDVIKAGWIGKPIHFSFTRIGGYPENVKGGDNVLFDLAVHDIDILNLLAGRMKLLGGIAHSTIKKGINDTAEILLRSDKGPSASIHVNWITPTKVRTLRVTGTRGVGFIDYMLQTCTVYGGNLLGYREEPKLEFNQLLQAYQNNDRIEFGVKKEEPLKVQLDNFYCLLSNKANNCCTPEEAVYTIDLAEEAIRRAKTRK